MPRSHSIQRETPTPTAKTFDGEPPKVFLSHASEDKNRFVVDFATRLRQRGIDVWLDQWEMLPGDSLVRKIFDEGLARAVAVIVVISKHSVAKPWVREELDIAVVRKINQSSKLIPVVIDECAVPECLQATIWEKITDSKIMNRAWNESSCRSSAEVASQPLPQGRLSASNRSFRSVTSRPWTAWYCRPRAKPV